MRSKTEERRQLILDVAAELFMQAGFEKASMAEISSRVGGSKATLYNYFPSKDELFLAVMEHKARRHLEAIFSSLHEPGLLGERLRHFGERYLRIRLSDELVAIHRMAEHEGSRTEVGRLLFNNGVRRGWGLVANFLRQAMDSGALPACDPWVAAWHLKALLEAELREPRVLGVLSALPEDAELGAVVDRALAVWARGYEVQMAAPLPAGPGPGSDDQATPAQPAASVSR